MKDYRTKLITELVADIQTATGKVPYTRLPKAAQISYPYIHISDIYDSEIGDKTIFEHEVDMLINVVHLDVNSLADFYTDINNIKSIINNNSGVDLSPDFKCREMRLNLCTTSEIETEVGTLNIANIRILFYIDEL